MVDISPWTWNLLSTKIKFQKNWLKYKVNFKTFKTDHSIIMILLIWEFFKQALADGFA